MLDVFFREDIAHVLTGLVVLAVATHVANGSGNTEHLDGALTMARGLARTFGLRWPTVVGDVPESLGSGYAGLLDRSASRAIAQRLTVYLVVVALRLCMSHKKVVGHRTGVQ